MENNRENYVHAGMHLQNQKIGRSEKENKEIIKKFSGNKDVFNEIKDKSVGLDLTGMQNKAVTAVQSLLDQTGHKGNMPSSFMESSSLGMNFSLPVIKFTPAEFYEAFGLKKHKRGEYEKYYGGDCKQALEALRSLYEKKFIFSYTRKSFEKGKEEKAYIKYYSNLFIEAVEHCEENIKKDRYLKHITITLSPIFIDQIQNYHTAKPKGYLNEVKSLAPRASKFVYSFIEQVLFQSRVNKGGTIRVKEETLAYQLWMNKYIKKKKWAEIRKVIKKCLEIAEKLDFISDCKYENGMVEFKILYKRLIKVKTK